MKVVYTLSGEVNPKTLLTAVRAFRDMNFEAGRIAYGAWWKGAIAWLRSLPMQTNVSREGEKTIVEYDFWMSDEYVGRLLIDVFKVKLAQGRARANAEKMEILHGDS